MPHGRTPWSGVGHFDARAGFSKPVDELTAEDLDPLIDEGLAAAATR